MLDRSLYFQELEQKATEVREQAQQEVASLQDVHQSKMAALKKRHKDEITQLKSQISSFEQQLNDGTCILNILWQKGDSPCLTLNNLELATSLFVFDT